MPVFDNYQAVITAVPAVGPGIAESRRQIEKGLKGTGAGPSGAEAEKSAAGWGKLSLALRNIPDNLKVLYHSGGLGKAVDELKEARRASEDFGQSLRGFAPSVTGIAALGSVVGFAEMLRGFADYGVGLRNVSAPLGGCGAGP